MDSVEINDASGNGDDLGFGVSGGNFLFSAKDQTVTWRGTLTVGRGIDSSNFDAGGSSYLCIL